MNPTADMVSCKTLDQTNTEKALKMARKDVKFTMYLKQQNAEWTSEMR